jgi:peroxiredoxin
MDIDYRFNGDPKRPLCLRYYQMLNGKNLGRYSYKPIRVQSGQHTARARLAAGPHTRKPFKANQIGVFISDNDGVVAERLFPYEKTWHPPKRVKQMVEGSNPDRTVRANPGERSNHDSQPEPSAIRVGARAPDFEAQKLDGQLLKLKEFRGKYVLLDFWATWCGPCVAATPHLKAVWKKFGNNSRFVILAVSLDHTKDAPRDYAEKHSLGWIQAWLGQNDGWPVVRSYGQRDIPSIFLIGPNGRFLAVDIRGPRMIHEVRKALSAAPDDA